MSLKDSKTRVQLLLLAIIIVVGFFVVNLYVQNANTTEDQKVSAYQQVENITPTPKPQLFGNISPLAINTKATFTELSELEKFIIVSGDETFYKANGIAVELPKNDYVLPTVSFDDILPPCRPGNEFYLTGYVFSLPADGLYRSGYNDGRYHPGYDGRCRNSNGANIFVASSFKGVVLKIYSNLGYAGSSEDKDTWDLWSSGRTYIIGAKTDDGCEIRGIYGHLKFPRENDTFPNAGDTVESGQAIGIEGETGAAYGVHLHFGLVKICGDTQEWINPQKTNAAGIRP